MNNGYLPLPLHCCGQKQQSAVRAQMPAAGKAACKGHSPEVAQMMWTDGYRGEKVRDRRVAGHGHGDRLCLLPSSGGLSHFQPPVSRSL